MSQIAPGWYPDPAAANPQLRWWDGEKWTEHTHPIPQPQTGSPSTLQTSAPEVSTPQASTPQVSTPQASTPDTSSSETATPAATDTGQQSLNYPDGATTQSAESPTAQFPAMEPSGTQPTAYQPPGDQPPAYQPQSGQPPAYQPQAAQPTGSAYPPQGQQGGQFGQYGPLSSRYVTFDGQPLAGWGSRFAARVIDFVLIWVWTMLLRPSTTAEYFRLNVQYGEDAAANGGSLFDLPAMPEALVSAATQLGITAIVVGLVYRIIMLKWRQATLGKLALGLRVREFSRPGPLPMAVILKRLFGEYWVLPVQAVPLLGLIGYLYRLVNYLWPLWDDNRMALHDRFARTQVVRVR